MGWAHAALPAQIQGLQLLSWQCGHARRSLWLLLGALGAEEAVVQADRWEASLKGPELRMVRQIVRVRQDVLDGRVLSAIDADAHLLRLEQCGIADKIRKAVAMYGATLSQIFSRDQTAHVSRARGEAMMIVRDDLNWSYPAIGEFFNRNHSTVIYQIRKARLAGRST